MIRLQRMKNSNFRSAVMAVLCRYWKNYCLTLYQTSPGFYVSAVQVFWKHCGKRRNCSWQAIPPFPTVFYLFGELSAIFILFEIVVCKLFQFGGVWNLSFGKGLKLKMTTEENFPPFSSNSKLSSATSFILEESKICCLGKSYTSPTHELFYWKWQQKFN